MKVKDIIIGEEYAVGVIDERAKVLEVGTPTVKVWTSGDVWGGHSVTEKRVKVRFVSRHSLLASSG